MGALPAAQKTLHAIVRNPILLVVALALAIGSGAVAASSQIPLVGFLVSIVFGIIFFFVEPFLAGGLLGMGREALAGETELETFPDEGKRVYLRLLAARLAEWIISLVLFGALFVVAVLLLIVLVGIGSLSDGSETIIGALGLVGLLLIAGLFGLTFLIYYAVGFLIQFHPAAIVVDDVDLVEGLQRSVDLVKENPIGALGYTVLVVVVSGTIGAIPVVYITITGSVVEVIAQENPEALLGLGLLNAGIYFGLFVVIQTLLLPFLRTYHVAFYLDETGTDSEGQ
jgi:hypothetical protein